MYENVKEIILDIHTVEYGTALLKDKERWTNRFLGNTDLWKKSKALKHMLPVM